MTDVDVATFNADERAGWTLAAEWLEEHGGSDGPRLAAEMRTRFDMPAPLASIVDHRLKEVWDYVRELEGQIERSIGSKDYPFDLATKQLRKCVVGELKKILNGQTQPSIVCPVCGMRSFHPQDIEHGYCGNCHEFTGE